MRMSSLLTLAVAVVFASGSAFAQQEPPLPIPDVPAVPSTPPAPSTPIVPVPDHPGYSAEPIVLYTNVEYDDRDEIPRCAVPTVIAIPDPCNPGCCRYIEVCVIPDCEPRMKTSPSGLKIRYYYGDFEIEITNKRSSVEVEYDS